MLPLNDKEQAIIELVCKGKTNADIAVILGSTENTVGNYMRLICAKLDAKNRSEACANFVKKSK
jgi:DNA-binding CsgD family transcriptional regulator